MIETGLMISLCVSGLCLLIIAGIGVPHLIRRIKLWLKQKKPKNAKS